MEELRKDLEPPASHDIGPAASSSRTANENSELRRELDEAKAALEKSQVEQATAVEHYSQAIDELKAEYEDDIKKRSQRHNESMKNLRTEYESLNNRIDSMRFGLTNMYRLAMDFPLEDLTPEQMLFPEKIVNTYPLTRGPWYSLIGARLFRHGALLKFQSDVNTLALAGSEVLGYKDTTSDAVQIIQDLITKIKSTSDIREHTLLFVQMVFYDFYRVWMYTHRILENIVNMVIQLNRPGATKQSPNPITFCTDAVRSLDGCYTPTELLLTQFCAENLGVKYPYLDIWRSVVGHEFQWNDRAEYLSYAKFADACTIRTSEVEAQMDLIRKNSPDMLQEQDLIYLIPYGVNNKRLDDPSRSIFEGASAPEIIQYLRGIRAKKVMDFERILYLLRSSNGDTEVNKGRDPPHSGPQLDYNALFQDLS